MNPKPPLTGKQRRHLRSLAHHLEPVVLIGKNGLVAGVVHATSLALETHELVKVKHSKDCPVTRDEVAAFLVEAIGAQLVGVIGHTVLLYLRHPSEPKITLPRV